MSYFNYHAKAKKLILEGKLLNFCFMEKYNSISPALVLFFNDEKHPVMPIRENKISEYISLIEKVLSEQNVRNKHDAKTE